MRGHEGTAREAAVGCAGSEVMGCAFRQGPIREAVISPLDEQPNTLGLTFRTAMLRYVPKSRGNIESERQQDRAISAELYQ
jgi:hypothetical protein